MSNSRLPQTPSQTVGPFFHFGMVEDGDENNLVSDAVKGNRIVIRGRVLDGEGEAVPDALLEIWQADANGFYNHPDDPHRENADPNFRGFGRADTVAEGQFSFRTVKPGRVPFDSRRLQAPHINVRIFSRGMLTHAYTRFYFSDEEEANSDDIILNFIEPERRPTVMLQRQDGSDPPIYILDVRLQGRDETVFFDP
ncbi:protocatechuate 3,4-dioxygenase subunit alpha [soil metagenome]